ncbi:hypothetical protein B0A49_06841 [Cryomyces minteri]|uniref:Cell wall protein n=1 Tax=Cryomyces minteri TaxID=331657 RepID=A0A4V5NEN6_9PEZI|nr:hypothetical protein B0A49_06841 [Cryomyces minteri]
MHFSNIVLAASGLALAAAVPAFQPHFAASANAGGILQAVNDANASVQADTGVIAQAVASIRADMEASTSAQVALDASVRMADIANAILIASVKVEQNVCHLVNSVGGAVSSDAQRQVIAAIQAETQIYLSVIATVNQLINSVRSSTGAFTASEKAAITYGIHAAGAAAQLAITPFQVLGSSLGGAAGAAFQSAMQDMTGAMASLSSVASANVE